MKLSTVPLNNGRYWVMSDEECDIRSSLQEIAKLVEKGEKAGEETLQVAVTRDGFAILQQGVVIPKEVA